MRQKIRRKRRRRNEATDEPRSVHEGIAGSKDKKKENMRKEKNPNNDEKSETKVVENIKVQLKSGPQR